MTIEMVRPADFQLPTKTPPREYPLIDEKDIRAILYLGIRGKVSLPVEDHKVDILA
jgi:hypothetical protein